MICCILSKLQNVLNIKREMNKVGRGGCTASLVCIACGISPLNIQEMVAIIKEAINFNNKLMWYFQHYKVFFNYR